MVLNGHFKSTTFELHLFFQKIAQNNKGGQGRSGVSGISSKMVGIGCLLPAEDLATTTTRVIMSFASFYQNSGAAMAAWPHPF